jgi:protein-disulfide isomerase
VLGTAPQLAAEYIETGQLKAVFWPVLNHGNPSVYATLAADCAGQQDPALFWAVHEALFQNQRDLWSADRDYYVNLAAGFGADPAAFELCYDDGSGLERVMALDALRRERGIFGQPTFDINGQVIAGLPAYSVFQAAFDTALQNGSN